MGNLKGLGRQIFSVVGALMLAASLAVAVEPETRGFTDGQSGKVKGVILSRDGETMKVRDEDNSVAVVDITQDTKVEMKHGFLKMAKTSMEVTALVPGLRVEVSGKGNTKGELVAERVRFDPGSLKSSRAMDARVSPLEGRQGELEGRSKTLEGRTGQIEGRTGQLEEQGKQTMAQVQTAQGDAAKANQGVNSVNQRVAGLDDYDTKESATVYFPINKSDLSEEAKNDLKGLAQKAVGQKGYMIEVAGFADSTGDWYKNQELSNKRAQMVVMYLQQEGDIPLRRILAPAAMGVSHAAADNNTKDGRKMNRRVEVKVLINHSLAANEGGASTTSAPAAGAAPASTPAPAPQQAPTPRQ